MLKAKDNISIQCLIRSIENSEVTCLGVKDNRGQHVAFKVHQALDHLVEVSFFGNIVLIILSCLNIQGLNANVLCKHFCAVSDSTFTDARIIPLTIS
jgi:hypothetical protein